eukprot:Gb_10706 [translate_table: standard]
MTPEELQIGLLPDRGINHHIDLIPGSSLPNQVAYRLSLMENAELNRQVQKLLEKEVIRESLTPCLTPALLAPKKDGSWQLCVDSRAMNHIIIKYKFPKPRMDDIMDSLTGAAHFSKINLRSGYYRSESEREMKTTFKTREGLYEWRVMSFGLIGAPNMFMRLMNTILKALISKCMVVYLDDILVYSRSWSKYMQHLRQVFSTLRRERLYVNLEKCSFGQTKMKYLGFIMSCKGLKMDEENVKAMLDMIVIPMIECIKGKVFQWTSSHSSFTLLKKKVLEAPVLSLSDFDKVFEVECDAYGVRIGIVLRQEG